jgi:hypothetical protein
MEVTNDMNSVNKVLGVVQLNAMQVLYFVAKWLYFLAEWMKAIDFLQYSYNSQTVFWGPCHSPSNETLNSHHKASVSIRGDFLWDLWSSQWHSNMFLSEFFSFPCWPSFYHCSIYICHCHLICLIALIGQHIITY